VQIAIGSEVVIEPPRPRRPARSEEQGQELV